MLRLLFVLALTALGSATAHAAGFSLSGGGGFTYVNYVENPIDYRPTQLGFTPKFSASFGPFSGFDVGLSTFFTLFPIVHTSGLPWARFYGVNARVGYRLKPQWAGADWKILGGWYWWGMAVKGDLYGLAQLSGPQIFFMVDFARSVRPFFAYLKYAPTAESLGSFSFTNCELAAGGGVRVAGGEGKMKLDLTFDLSRTTFSAPSIGKDMSLMTFTVGVQMPLISPSLQ